MKNVMHILQKFSAFNRKAQWMHIVKNQQGFTLIELMLVIVMISVIMVFSFSAFQQQNINFKIDKTALQMQQWLEAAKAYYVDNNVWPDGSKEKSCSGDVSSATRLLLEGRCGAKPVVYIQAGSADTDAWGSDFMLIPPKDPQVSQVFQVQAFIANTGIQDDEEKNIQLAKRLASRLPNANVIKESLLGAPISVVASVVIPAQASNNASAVVIESVEDLQCRDLGNGKATCITPLKPNCPPGMQPELHVALQGVQAAKDPTQYAYFASAIATPSDNSFTAPGLTTISALGNYHGGSLLGIVTCERKTASVIENNMTALPFTF